MVVKADQERIKALLKDTITLLCKNGLTFKSEFSIEALIGITLDKDDVFLVSISELVQSELGIKLAAAQQSRQHHQLVSNVGDDNENDEDSAHDNAASPSTGSRKRRKRRRSRRDDQDGEKGLDEASDDSFTETDESSSQSEPPSKKTPMAARSTSKNVKQEDDDDDDSKDIVFIKEEVDNWQSMSHGQTNFSDLQGISSNRTSLHPNENFDFLHSGSLVPMGSQQQGASNMWPDMAQNQTGANQSISSPGSKRTSTVTSNAAGSQQMDDSQQQVQSPRGEIDRTDVSEYYQECLSSEPGRPFTCPTCFKCFKNKTTFKVHINTHVGIFKYNCKYCGKGFSGMANYRGHMVLHTAVKDYKCNICGMEFGYKHVLKTHVMRCHGQNIHQSATS